jgi:hypothetical protein
MLEKDKDLEVETFCGPGKSFVLIETSSIEDCEQLRGKLIELNGKSR